MFDIFFYIGQSKKTNNKSITFAGMNMYVRHVKLGHLIQRNPRTLVINVSKFCINKILLARSGFSVIVGGVRSLNASTRR